MRTLAFERDNGLVNVVVAAPQGVANTIPAVWEVTEPSLSIVRMHGRNRDTWIRKGLATSAHRFNYDSVRTSSRKSRPASTRSRVRLSAPDLGADVPRVGRLGKRLRRDRRHRSNARCAGATFRMS